MFEYVGVITPSQRCKGRREFGGRSWTPCWSSTRSIPVSGVLLPRFRIGRTIAALHVLFAIRRRPGPRPFRRCARRTYIHPRKCPPANGSRASLRRRNRQPRPRRTGLAPVLCSRRELGPTGRSPSHQASCESRYLSRMLRGLTHPNRSTRRARGDVAWRLAEDHQGQRASDPGRCPWPEGLRCLPSESCRRQR